MYMTMKSCQKVKIKDLEKSVFQNLTISFMKIIMRYKKEDYMNVNKKHTRLATRSVTFHVRMYLLYWAPANIPQNTSTIIPRP